MAAVKRLWFAWVVSYASAAVPGGDVRQLAEGPVQGTCHDGLCEFLGLPYAAAPVEQLRWRPPQPLTPWTELRSARSFGSNCVQAMVKGRSIIGSLAETEGLTTGHFGLVP
eukprot:Skav236463  [mRNA]  locus=scaffold1758:572580:576495:+ [translate_table: standard]